MGNRPIILSSPFPPPEGIRGPLRASGALWSTKELQGVIGLQGASESKRGGRQKAQKAWVGPRGPQRELGELFMVIRMDGCMEITLCPLVCRLQNISPYGATALRRLNHSCFILF